MPNQAAEFQKQFWCRIVFRARFDRPAQSAPSERILQTNSIVDEVWNGFSAAAQHIQTWPIDRLVFYARNPRKNDAAVDRMCGSIREFGFKIPVLARSDGEVVDGHLRLKAARKLGHHRSPGDPLRRVDAGAGEGIPADGERSVDVGGLGRGTARPRIAGTQRRGFRSRA